jgi:Mg/Co/Ni transporter MgtE
MDYREFLLMLNDIRQIDFLLKKIPKEKAEEVLNKMSDKEKEDLIDLMKKIQSTIIENIEVDK